MHFGTKSYLKSTRNHTAKHTLNIAQEVVESQQSCRKHQRNLCHA